jgi:hypothetical protein
MNRKWVMVVLGRTCRDLAEMRRLLRMPPAERPRWEAFVYLMRAETGEYKIGYTECPEARRRQLSRADRRVELLEKYRTRAATALESALHRRFEWWRIGRTEWFRLGAEQAAKFLDACREEEGPALTEAIERDAERLADEVRLDEEACACFYRMLAKMAGLPSDVGPTPPWPRPDNWDDATLEAEAGRLSEWCINDSHAYYQRAAADQ